MTDVVLKNQINDIQKTKSLSFSENILLNPIKSRVIKIKYQR